MNIKNPAFIGALGLIALVLGLTGWYMSTHPAPVVSQPNVNPDGALESDTPANSGEDSAYSTISVTYPTKITFPLSSRSDAGLVAERVMKAWVDQTVAEFKRYAAENEAAIADFIAQGEPAPASLSSQLTIEYEKKSGPRTITYLFTSASYTGGAHGIEVPVTFTFHHSTGAQVTLSDLFLPGYLARLSDIAHADLPSAIGEDANEEFILTGTGPDEANFQAFYLEGSRIVFLFPPYQVGPYALGTVTLPIELSRLDEILKPEYR